MGKLEINLLKTRRAISEKEYLRERKMFVISLTTFLSLFLIMSVFFGLQMFELWQVKKTKTQVNKAEARLADLNIVTQNQLYLRSRLDLVRDFLKTRVRGREAVERVFSLNVPGVVVASVSFGDKQILRVRLNAVSVIALDETFRWLKSDDFFLQVINRGVSKLENGEYTMQLELTMPQGEGV